MLLFRCTKDATAALTTTRKGAVQSWVDNTPLPDDVQPWVWQLHAVKIARQNVLVAMQTETRFAMVFWGLKKGDGETLLRLFYERLANHLLWQAEDAVALDKAASQAMLDRLLQKHTGFRFHTGSNCSVQTHINEVVHCCRDAVADNGCLPDNREEAAGFDEFLNQGIRSVKGGAYFQPAEELLCACLRDFAGMAEPDIAKLRERLKAQRRQALAQSMLQHAEIEGMPEDDPAHALMMQLLAQAQGKGRLH
ncbi:DUF6933 domain-containing protein [Vogesella indigofera]|uniref:DUF6933 domain-containing protein n=1 Tax=Vogesella indigofera TaxID=45465 RepID=UPI00234F2EDF|nr:hypothetical protein [Vogesella indigofera]MDC7698330.1 hypothetical protein [Vogesella indigofera]